MKKNHHSINGTVLLDGFNCGKMVVVDDGCDSPDDNGDDDNADDDVKLKTNLILKKIYITFLNSEP